MVGSDVLARDAVDEVRPALEGGGERPPTALDEPVGDRALGGEPVLPQVDGTRGAGGAGGALAIPQRAASGMSGASTRHVSAAERDDSRVVRATGRRVVDGPGSSTQHGGGPHVTSSASTTTFER